MRLYTSKITLFSIHDEKIKLLQLRRNSIQNRILCSQWRIPLLFLIGFGAGFFYPTAGRVYLVWFCFDDGIVCSLLHLVCLLNKIQLIPKKEKCKTKQMNDMLFFPLSVML